MNLEQLFWLEHVIIVKILFGNLFILDYSKADDIYLGWIAVILLISM